MKKQFGRSMIEMLGVLAIIGVLSIGGIALYRRAVNNHHANTILDDVNRLAFVIIEKGNYPLGEDLPKGDFKESGIYTLKGHQAAGANQFSILVSNVPKGVCEPLLDKAIVDYKVGVVAAGGSVDDEIIYDSLNTDLCQDMNDVAFYFGDTSLVCNEPNESGYTPCTVNSDCCGEYFCQYSGLPLEGAYLAAGTIGRCRSFLNFPAVTETMSDGKIWTRSTSGMTFWNALNWCTAHGLNMATQKDIDCARDGRKCPYPCTTSKHTAIREKWGTSIRYWLELDTDGDAFVLHNGVISDSGTGYSYPYALCH